MKEPQRPVPPMSVAGKPLRQGGGQRGQSSGHDREEHRTCVREPPWPIRHRLDHSTQAGARMARSAFDHDHEKPQATGIRRGPTASQNQHLNELVA